MEINMLVEKKYQLIKELLEKMLNLQLEAEEESTMAFELIKFIKSMLEELNAYVGGKLVLVGDDGIPLKPLNVDGQATVMDPFPCLSNTFGTPNTSTKVAIAGTSDTQSNNGEDGLVNKVAHFRTLIAPADNGADVFVSLESVLQVKEHFENRVYGFFRGKRVAYTLVENYVKNTWSRFGLVPTMINSKGIFFFKFSSNTGMESMLKNVLWLILIVPLILRKWSPLANVSTEDLKRVPVWVKLHDVSITAFTEDGMSATDTKMCLKLKVMDIDSIQFELNTSRNRLDVQLVRHVQTTYAKKKDYSQAKQNDTNSNKVNSNNYYGLKFMVDVASSSDVNLDNEENDSENAVEEDNNETTSFMASKSSKGTCPSKSEGGTGKKSLYEHWKDDYDDN
ncbi:RNA-directed DNA polymerase, eukaryota, reverse transcriptase zinc-binding domain protein [Tanacetum coccineum]